MSSSFRLQKKAADDLETRWFIWTIVLLLVIGFSLSGYIMVSTEKETAQTYDSPLVGRQVIK